jgi:S-(hydroxymethyl)glutathione dehydrogenase/alcohol dehydrogenase
VKGEDPVVMTQVGAFAEQTVVAEASLVKIDRDIPLAAAALVSCGVATGWGSAVQRAGTTAGDTVVVVGVGGVGMNAVQGAAAAGAQRVVAVDPVEWKLERAREFGATHVAASTGDAVKLVNDLTRGQMADRVILTPGVLYGDILAAGLDLTGKGGTCVATALAPVMQNDVQLNLAVLSLWNKEVKGTVFGSLNPREHVPALLALYREGKLKLDELITRTYDLDHINDGFRDLREGRNIRGVITFD